MLTVGEKFPSFRLKAVTTPDAKEFPELTDQEFQGKWKVVYFWPKDFTFVCPTEILAFGDMDQEFKDRDAQVIGVSTDSDYVHLAWRKSREDLGGVPHPWLSDIRKELAHACGVLDEQEGVANRATFVVDPNGIIRFVSVNDMSVGRNPQEVLRVIDALQTDELCPCNWHPGEETIKAA